ncbi:HTH-type transcriptional repressor CytR [compost metagenome]
MFSYFQRLGYEEALRAAGISFDPDLCIEEAMTEEGGQRAARKLLSLPNPPTAFVCGQDMMAVGVMRAIAQAGKIPGQDIGVIGSDNHPVGQLVSPALTTFSAPTELVGKRMVELLLARMQGADPKTLQDIWTPELILRSSDGPPKAR